MELNQLQHIDQHIAQWLEHLDNVIPNLIAEMTTDTKVDRFDLVTNVDKQLQQQFEEYLNEHFPGHQLLGEEKNNDSIKPYEGHVWIMDPIDGTANLVKQQEDYCIILAYFEHGEPQLSYIYDYPHRKLYKAIKGQGAYMNDQPLQPPKEVKLEDAVISFGSEYINDRANKALYDAAFGVRYIGSCGLDSIRVIKGQFGAHFNTDPKPWDISAQFLFAKQLGLKITRLDGGPLDYAKGGPFIISNKGCYEEMLSILNEGSGYLK
ncbi:inositol monophosphatase family protein [Staphylococcus petrasii]|uniref:inositol monophosphatase family protein n=1 Tax=Staphylococcus petrasii TaxID=1276936 RepID=UPI001F59D2F5|nr:inositol monophosphatase family protein [Staphylococcus petrasii]MCI2774737.1 inositol monophosphatase family protein [Staphylococcus petrasii]